MSTAVNISCDGKTTTSLPTSEQTAMRHWGEIIPNQSPTKSMSVVDMDSTSLNPKSIDLEGPHLHQPSAQQKTITQLPLSSEICHPDAISIHTIQLLKHNRRIRTIIAASQQLQTESSKWDDRTARPRLQALPPTPLLLLPPKRSWMANGDNNGQAEQRDETPRSRTFYGGVEVDDDTSRTLSGRAVATICAHAGYEMSQESAVETLTDVLREYLTKVCKLLRAAVDREALTGCTGFQDVLSQVLQEIGVGGTETLYKFWKVRIKDYHAVIQKRNTQLRETYDNLRNPCDASVLLNDSKLPRCKEEPFVDIQFPDTEQDSEVAPEVPEQPNQPLNFQSLNTMELEEQARPPTSIAEDENHWYPSAYVKTEPGTEVGTRQEESQGAETEEHSIKEEEDVGTSHANRSPAVVVDVDVTSLQARTSQEQTEMNPKKKRKK